MTPAEKLEIALIPVIGAVSGLMAGWLPTRSWRWLFLLSYRTIESLAVGVVGWALILF